MSKSIRNGCGILVLAILIVGCAKQEDKLVKEQVATIEKTAELFEKVTDKASFEAMQPEIDRKSTRLNSSHG